MRPISVAFFSLRDECHCKMVRNVMRYLSHCFLRFGIHKPHILDDFKLVKKNTKTTTPQLNAGNSREKFLLFKSLHYYPQAPLCAVLNRTGSAILRFYTAETRRRNDLEKKKLFMLKSAYHVDSISQIKNVIYT